MRDRCATALRTLSACSGRWRVLDRDVSSELHPYRLHRAPESEGRDYDAVTYGKLGWDRTYDGDVIGAMAAPFEPKPVAGLELAARSRMGSRKGSRPVASPPSFKTGRS